MPIYEYRCSHCGHQFEVMHAVDAKPPKCERCGREVRRVFTPVGIIFKGSGWHITDYRKTPAPADGGAKKGETAPSGKTTGGDGKSGAADSGTSPAAGETKPAGGAKSGGAGSKPASRSGGGEKS